ncbi:hypothetical protein NPIL_563751, partial [Nephila pilipes]
IASRSLTTYDITDPKYQMKSLGLTTVQPYELPVSRHTGAIAPFRRWRADVGNILLTLHRDVERTEVFNGLLSRAPPRVMTLKHQ